MAIIPIIAVTIVIIASLMVFRYINAKRTGYPLADERTAKATGMAAQIAILIGSYLMILLNVYNLFLYKMIGWNRIDAMPALNLTVIVMNLSYGLLILFFTRKETM